MRDPATAARGSRSSVMVRWLVRSRGTAQGELRAVAAVLAVVLVMTVFRAIWPLGYEEPFDAAEQFAMFVSDLALHSALALAMYLIVESVRRIGPERGVYRWLALAAALLVASIVAALGRTLFMVTDGADGDLWGTTVPVVLRFLFPAAMLVTVAEFHRRELQSLEAMRAAEAARHALETQTLQARLRTLEAQIEPHFLFNTLATVRRLYETDRIAGEAMMDRLMGYLQVALPSMRGDAVTLAREAELIRAYLDLHKVRMGRRLEYRIKVPERLGTIEVPPMMLLTLVENAIKHGLAPQREGGRVDIDATVEGDRLKLCVSDTGRGFGSHTSGGGTGLANIRARLAALFGQAAELSLAPHPPHGMQATITLPAGAA